MRHHCCNQWCDGVFAAINQHHRHRRPVRSFTTPNSAATRRILVILAICSCILFNVPVVQAGYFVNPADGCDGSDSSSAAQGGGGPAGGLRAKEFHNEVPWGDSGMDFVVNGNSIDDSSQNVVLDNSKTSYDLAIRPSDPSMTFAAGLIRILVQGAAATDTTNDKPIFTFEPSTNVQPTDSTIAWECDALAGEDVAGVMYMDDEQPKSSVTGTLTLPTIPTQDLLILVDVTVVLFEPADTTLLSDTNPIRYTYQFFTLSMPGSGGGTTTAAPVAAPPPPAPAPVPVSTPQPLSSPVTSEPVTSSTRWPTKAPATKSPTSAMPQAPIQSPITSSPKAPTRNPSTTIPTTTNPTKVPTRLPTIAIGDATTATSTPLALSATPSTTPSLRSRTTSPTLRPSVAPMTTQNAAIPAPASMASGNATAANTPTTPTAANATSPLSTISLTASPAAMTLLDGGITDKEADAVNAQSSNSGSNQTVLLASIIGGVVIVVVGLVVFAVLRRTRLQLQHYPNTMEMSSASKAQLPLSSSPLQDDTSNTNTGSNERDSAPENSHARLAQSSDGRKVTRRGSPTEKVDSTESSPDDSISDVTRTWTASSITPVSVEHAINAKQIGDYAAGAAAVANLEYKDQARTVVAVHTGSSTPKTTMPVSPTETRHDNDNRPIVDPKEMSDDRAVEGLAFKDQARTVVALPTMSSTPDSHNGPATIEPTSNVQAPTPPPPLPPPVAVAVAASASTATSTPIAQATLMNEVALNAGNMSASAGEPLSDGGGITEQKRPTIDP